ncbi:AraC family transcriptional regulator [Cellvibrio japonicus]|nr:helix-turn-helix domain-containing protein [Cellvibrio japonicus]QEI13108.1 helix-turn-helix transcriptional regulator [Cellvibrio japonicus]QEI16682.1 helix-turn-helix transcriptional regulator [Cellvibrio japonicus]QEI20260.1 helix-turn-helix transcriptional regulator [Cellvibrio japonicus]
MNETIFNIHDLVLMMTAIQCACFVILILVTNPRTNNSNYFLAAFLLTHVFIPMHELVLWGADFKMIALDHYPRLFMWMGFGYYLDAALLYFYIKSLVYQDFQLRWRDSLHLIPLAVFALFLTFTFYNHSLAERIILIDDDIYMYSPGYLSMDLLCKLARISYCAACLLLIRQYRNRLKITHSNIERVDIRWLISLVIGFLVIAIMEAGLAFAKILHLFVPFHPHWFEVIGLTGYYVVFVLVLALVFTSIRYFSGFIAIAQREAHRQIPEENLFNRHFIDNIDTTMRAHKPYLQPDLTLDMLAETLEIPARDLSLIFSRHFDSNFYEFVNRYRIEEAKRMLADPKHKGKTITHIYLDAGFNSKSVFNTLFKKYLGQTPSEYRLAQLRHA